MSPGARKISAINAVGWLLDHPIMAGTLLLGCIAFIVALPLYKTEVERHEPDKDLVVTAHGTTTVSQSFVASRPWITWIEFTTGDLEATAADTAISLFVQPLDSDEVIYQTTAPLAKIVAGENAIRFSFSPFLTRPGHRYKATIRVADPARLSRLPLTYQQADEYYREGNYWINDLPRKGDVGFRLGAFRPLWYTVQPHVGISAPWWKWVLLVIIGLTVARIVRHSPDQPQYAPSPRPAADKGFAVHLGILLLVTLTLGIAAYLLGSRAFYDTAHDGLETIEEVLHGNIQPFYEHYTGHQPLMDWVLAILFLGVGVSTATLHSVGIGAYVVTVALFVFVARRLWNTTAGWYAGWYAASSHWLLLVMHEGARLVLIPPLMLGALWAMLQVREAATWQSRILCATIGGLAVGGLGYVYAVGWMMIIAYALALVAWWLYGQFTSAPPARGATIALMALVALVTLWPLIVYAQENPHRILERPRALVAEAGGTEIARQLWHGAASSAAAFAYIPLVPWGDNAQFSVAGIPVYFPIPLVAPSVALLLILALGLWLIPLRQRRRPRVIGWLFLFFIFGWVPSLITIGPQPHFRRSIAAIVPLLLLVAWSSAAAHRWIQPKSPWWRTGWVLVMTSAVLYGPFLYFGYALPSPWYSSMYYPDHDILARRLFPYVAAGHNVALIGNRAHLKSLQFYALASPYDKNAFTLKRIPDTNQLALADVAAFDVLVINHRDCQKMPAPGFSSAPLLIEGKFNLIGCIYVRDGILRPPRKATTALPHRGPLWKAVLTKAPPFDHYDPFRGPIFSR